MVSDTSPVKDYYPIDFDTDLNGKLQDWEAVVLIPFIDEVATLAHIIASSSSCISFADSVNYATIVVLRSANISIACVLSSAVRPVSSWGLMCPRRHFRFWHYIDCLFTSFYVFL